MRIQPGYLLGILICGSLTLAPAPAAAQWPPVIHGWSGTIALQDNVDEFYRGVEKILVNTSDGIADLTDGRKPKAPDSSVEALDSLRPGTPVAVHYTVKGFLSSAGSRDGAGPTGNEGVVARVNRGKKRVTVRFADGAMETLKLAHHVGSDPAEHTHSRVVLIYPDEAGKKMALYFKPAD